MTKIATYCTALNESHNVDTWYNCIKDSDFILVGVGTSDTATRKKLDEYKVNQLVIEHLIVNWSDVRNQLLSLIPQDIDYCLSLDLDETITEDWVAQVKHEASISDVDIFVYDYMSATTPGHVVKEKQLDRLHHRHRYSWIYPCREVLRYTQVGSEVAKYLDSVKVVHKPDLGIDRTGKYLKSLLFGYEQYKSEPRFVFSLARELFNNQMFGQSIRMFDSYLSLAGATWKQERSRAYLYMSRCSFFLNKMKEAQNYLSLADQEEPNNREIKFNFAQFYIGLRQPQIARTNLVEAIICPQLDEYTRSVIVSDTLLQKCIRDIDKLEAAY